MGNFSVTVGKINITEKHQDDNGFWELMGRFFASRQVRNEMGIAMSSDENYLWYIAAIGESIVGFAATEIKQKGKAEFHHFYVLPEFRNNIFIYPILFNVREKRLIEHGVKQVFVTSNPKTSRFKQNAGYTELYKKGKYTRWMKNI